MLDLRAIRRQFPLLDQQVNGHALIYLDSAATAQKPRAVLDAMHTFYETQNGNANRGMHILAERATQVLEQGRTRVQKFLHAKSSSEIVFTKNATEAINLVAYSWGRKNLKKHDVVLLSILEHHSNCVPWLQLKEDIGIEVRWMDSNEEGQLKMGDLDEALQTSRVKLVAITGQSNVLGVRPDLQTIIHKSHDANALVLVDAAQLAAHHEIDVQKMDCDFLVFSSHKIYGPTGIGVLYAKQKILEQMPAFLTGGGMIGTVTKEGFTPADIPDRFEAGTQPLADIAGLHAALDWLNQYSWADIQAHESTLMQSAYEQLSAVPQVHIIGPKDPSHVSGCISFVVDAIHPHDLTDIVGKQGICLRAGHHCTQPLHTKLDVNATTRMSFGIYTTEEEITRCVDALAQVDLS